MLFLLIVGYDADDTEGGRLENAESSSEQGKQRTLLTDQLNDFYKCNLNERFVVLRYPLFFIRHEEILTQFLIRSASDLLLGILVGFRVEAYSEN